jgi:hypothetical protein
MPVETVKLTFDLAGDYSFLGVSFFSSIAANPVGSRYYSNPRCAKCSKASLVSLKVIITALLEN